MDIIPKITLIIPCYNVEKYISRCIECVINQTYSNIEIILIDDGSTDNTNKLIVKLIENLNNVKYIRNKNRGVSNARNTGLKNATGEYIMFLDSDDYISNNMIKNMYKLMSRYNTDLVKCNIKLEFIEDNISEEQKPVYSKLRYLSSDKFPKTIYKKILSTEILNSSCCCLYRTSIIKENNLFFREDIYNGEDAIFFMNYIDNCKNIVYTPTPYYHYVVRNTGLTGSGLPMKKLWTSKLKFIQELKDKEIKWDLEKYQYVKSKIIYIVVSCIYKLYKKDKNESDEFKISFLNEMIKDVNLHNLLNKVNYKDLNLTEDRISILDNIKENNLSGAVKIIKSLY
jgi:glycosyltransferase involved in cell wall biosynthesis